MVALMLGVQGMAQVLNVASFNIRCIAEKDAKTHDSWDERKQWVVDLIRWSDFDVFGSQEVTPAQMEYMKENLKDYASEGVGRDDGKHKGEHSPVFYKKDRFKRLDGGTFYISETPDKVSKGWDARYKRICSWVSLKDKQTKKTFYFFNLHMDHVGIVARREGSKVVVNKIREIAGEKANVILTGDFNVDQNNEIFKIFENCGFMKDSYASADFRFVPTGTFNGFKASNFTTRRIDHIWVTNPIKVERYGVLTYHYYRPIGGSEDVVLRDAPKEIKAEKREIHLPSDHYPIQAFVRLK